MCNCNKGERWIVTLATGTKITKRGTEAQVKAYASRHKGATYAAAPTPAKRGK